VRRQDTGNSDASGGHPSAGDRQLKLISGQTANSATTFPCGVDPPGRQDAGQSLGLVLVGRGTTEIVPDRGNGLPDFLQRGARSNFDVHNATRSQGFSPDASRSVSPPAVAGGARPGGFLAIPGSLHSPRGDGPFSTAYSVRFARASRAGQVSQYRLDRCYASFEASLCEASQGLPRRRRPRPAIS
jgi:hypothetical protein